MKTLIKYMILLLASGIIIPLYQHTGVGCKPAPVITPVTKAAKHMSPAKEGNEPETSFIRLAATKLLPVLKYF